MTPDTPKPQTTRTNCTECQQEIDAREALTAPDPCPPGEKP